MSMLRTLFGPSRQEVWRQLSTELGGRYVKPGFAARDSVEVTHGEWTVTLDTYVVSTGKTSRAYTRMRAPYVNPDGFRFCVYRRGVFSDIGKLFGMQDVHVGFEPFDRDFIVKGTSEEKLRYLFSNPRIRELVAAQSSIKFMVKDGSGWFGRGYPEGVDELSFVVSGVIKDVERLKGMYELFAETLDELCRMGSAYEGAPDLSRDRGACGEGTCRDEA